MFDHDHANGDHPAGGVARRRFLQAAGVLGTGAALGIPIAAAPAAPPQEKPEAGLLDHVTELANGFVEGRYSIKNMSNDEVVFVELDDVLVDCTPNEQGKESRFHCLREYLPDSWLDEQAMRLVATYEIDVSVVDGPTIGLLMRRVDRLRRD